MPQHVNNAIDTLNHEIARYPYSVHSSLAVVRKGVLEDSRDALIWAGDEIAALREDLSGAIGAVGQLLDELRVSESDNDDLRERLAEYEKDELLADQRLDYALGV